MINVVFFARMEKRSAKRSLTMKWNKFYIKTRSEVEDIVISTLADVGIEGVEIQDKQPLTESDKQQMFVDIMPDIPDDDGIAYLKFLPRCG